MNATVTRLRPRNAAQAEQEAHDRNRHPAYARKGPEAAPVPPAPALRLVRDRWLAVVPAEGSTP